MEEEVKEFETRTEMNLIEGLKVQSVGLTRTSKRKLSTSWKRRPKRETST